ncbi:MAG: FAD:protein FMN transferase [Anaerolineae bacterium]
MKQYVTSFRAMGCEMNVWLETDVDGDAILSEVPAWVENYEACLSRFRPESELSQLNARINQWTTVSETLLENIIAAKHAARLTNGLYNPLVLDALTAAGYDRSFEQITNPKAANATTKAQRLADWRDIEVDVARRSVCLPARIDLGGVAKGWAASAIADRLAHYGPCVVDMGGDMAARGCPQGEAGWDIAIADPMSENGSVTTLILCDTNVVTSGTDYRRWQQEGKARHHLIDPHTGQPAETDVVTVTVIHREAVVAEAYAKAIVMMGSQAGLEWVERQWAGAALVVRSDGAALANRRFEAYQKQEVPV